MGNGKEGILHTPKCCKPYYEMQFNIIPWGTLCMRWRLSLHILIQPTDKFISLFALIKSDLTPLVLSLLRILNFNTIFFSCWISLNIFLEFQFINMSVKLLWIVPSTSIILKHVCKPQVIIQSFSSSQFYFVAFKTLSVYHFDLLRKQYRTDLLCFMKIDRTNHIEWFVLINNVSVNFFFLFRSRTSG